MVTIVLELSGYSDYVHVFLLLVLEFLFSSVIEHEPTYKSIVDVVTLQVSAELKYF